MSQLFLLVPEAAASPDTIQFKLVLSGPVKLEIDKNMMIITVPLSSSNHTYPEKYEGIQPIVFRSYQQISWLHEQFCKITSVVVPTLPEAPDVAQMDDQDYVERKRLQLARYFDKIIRREMFCENEHFIYFLTNDMSPTQVGHHNSKGVLSFLRFNRAPKHSRGGFHSYKASEPVEGDENDIFHRHQIYILMQESYFGSIAEALLQMIQLHLADTLTDLGDMVIETTQSKYQLGDGITYRNLQRTSDRKMQLFGLLMDELGFYVTRQV
ncbi:hypothetical protein BJ944DRAFT_292284 [Cunninghamella echinulata]|nr:hypothetical protein BJ944DRAFT_292284 [Cunninghamella echinulata]